MDDHRAPLSGLEPTSPTVTPLAVPRLPDGRVDMLALATNADLLFESAAGVPGSSGWSFAVVGTAGHLVHDGTTTRLRTGTGVHDLGPDAFAAIEAVSAALDATPDDRPDPDAPPFVGGLAGALAYDLGRLVEAVPVRAVDDRHAPWMDLRVVTDLVAVDHRDESAWRVRRPLRTSPPAVDDDALTTRLTRDRADTTSVLPTSTRPVTTSLPTRDYLDALGRVLAHVAAGDVFQVNLAQRLTCRWTDGALELYRRLRAASPAPHAALFRQAPDRALASISPETFLSARGRHVQTRPIKGTRPRRDDPVDDRAARDRLSTSAKDRAENVMVVDMERNDLGRVCRPGSVRTTDLLRAEAHPTVWQLVSTVEGHLREDVGWGSLLRATFPSGSITGTPKVRAMQLIDELEPVRRSWYCGALGWLGPGGASLSVSIRTAALHGDRLDYGAGGGIVADSDPTAEVAESWAKARAFLAAVDAQAPDPEVTP